MRAAAPVRTRPIAASETWLIGQAFLKCHAFGRGGARLSGQRAVSLASQAALAAGVVGIVLFSEVDPDRHTRQREGLAQAV